MATSTMDVTKCGMRNAGGGSHVCAALQMLFHVPEVEEFLIDDCEHRKTCRSLLCFTCALFNQLMKILANECTLPSFFMDWWKRLCVNKVPEKSRRNAHEVLFRLITTTRWELYQRLKKSSQAHFACSFLNRNSEVSVWDSLCSRLFGGVQLVRVGCNECSASELSSEFLSVEINLRGEGCLHSQIELKLQERKEEFCNACDELTVHWKPLSVKMPQYLIVYASNCSLNSVQVQTVTVWGHNYVLQSCISQTETSPQSVFTKLSSHGIHRQFEDAQVKTISQEVFFRKGIPQNSSMTFLYVKRTVTAVPPQMDATKQLAAEESNDNITAQVNNLEDETGRISRGKDKEVTTCEVGTQTDLIDYDRMKHQCDFKTWTGVCVEDFDALYNLLGGDEVVLRLKQKYNLSTPQKIRKTRISGQNRLVLFFLRFRQGLTLKQLSFLFRLSESYISELFYVMTCHLCETLRHLSKHMFPSAAQQRLNKPLVMKPFKNLRVILDGISLSLETPSNFEQQGNTYSTYKHKNVALFIVGISAHGATIFCTEGMEGSMSDKVATLKSNLKELLDEGDCVMVDRGFELQNEMQEIGCKILRPPTKKKDQVFTKEEDNLTKAIAAARIYVEHAMADIRDNRIFKGDIPLTLIPIISKLVFIAAFMRNFSPSRISNVSFRAPADATLHDESAEDVDDPAPI